MISLINRLLSPKSSTPAPSRASENSNKSDDDDNGDVLASSRFQKTVILYNWWLVKANTDHEGNRLAIAGFTSRELQAKRVFTSAPIAKSYDPFSLETSDGIYIIIRGLINKSRTLENGFSSDVFSHFNLGFHYDWKAYAEKCFMKEVEAALDPIFAADAGTANLDSNAIPVDHKKVKGKRKRNAGDINKSFEYFSENTLAIASKSSDSSRHAANHKDTVNTNNHASTNFPQLMKSEKDNVSSLEDNIAVADTAEPSGYCVRGSSERMANSTSWRKGNTGTAAKSKTEERSKLDGNTMKNVALGTSPVPEGSDTDNANPSNLDPAVSLGDSEVVLGIPRTSEKHKENDRSKDGLDYQNINSSPASLPQDFDTNIRCPGEKSSGIASSCLLNVGHMVMGNLESRRKGNMGTKIKSKTERASSKGITVRNAASEDSPAPKGSDVNNGNPSNLDPAPSLEDSEVTLRISSSELKTSERQKENDKSKKNDHLCGELQKPGYGTLVRGRVKSAQGQPEKISQAGAPRQNNNPSRSRLVRDKLKKARGQPKRKIQAGTLGQNNDPSRSTLVRDKLKKAQGRSKKNSQAGTPWQNKNNSVKSPCVPDDIGHDCNLETAVDERERNANVVSSRKKAQRKINFDAHIFCLLRQALILRKEEKNLL
ncbi:uncharacterized protein LOC18039753 isoform X3 [Citrus clementina]|uniref:uncharacterized protein LOC18039753 isoform X3 n=1 Tax=Citrus clementina TaxID=85681 RepID=UPI000CED5240|nr:uncharacterized protein LOC18039753 isoform X3 [Citrus x clementina]